MGPKSLPELEFGGFGGFGFALKLLEFLNTNLVTVRANILLP